MLSRKRQCQFVIDKKKNDLNENGNKSSSNLNSQLQEKLNFNYFGKSCALTLEEMLIFIKSQIMSKQVVDSNLNQVCHNLND